MVRHHRAVAILCVVATLAMSGVLWLTVPVFHEARAQLVLLNPAQLDGSGRPLPTNPLVIAGSRPAQVMTSTLATVAAGEPFALELDARGVTSETTVGGSTGGGIVIALSAISRDPAVAAADLQTVIDVLGDELDAQQYASGAPDDQLYRLYEFVERSEPEQLPDDRDRSVLLGLALGATITVVALVVVSEPRRRRGPPERVAARAGSGP